MVRRHGGGVRRGAEEDTEDWINHKVQRAQRFGIFGSGCPDQSDVALNSLQRHGGAETARTFGNSK